MNIQEFCVAVDLAVRADYGHDDGGDLCFNLIELGTVKVDEGVALAAATVAQHIEQA